jgi:hypothetical protein
VDEHELELDAGAEGEIEVVCWYRRDLWRPIACGEGGRCADDCDQNEPSVHPERISHPRRSHQRGP